METNLKDRIIPQIGSGDVARARLGVSNDLQRKHRLLIRGERQELYEQCLGEAFDMLRIGNDTNNQHLKDIAMNAIYHCFRDRIEGLEWDIQRFPEESEEFQTQIDLIKQQMEKLNLS